ncbi:MAG: hypothetical protein AABX12_03925 [Nanoarchaeota archaeon]
MNPIKESFNKVKTDVDEIKTELNTLKQQIEELTRTFQHILVNQQTNQHMIPTHPTEDLPPQGLKSPNYDFSTGNRGVPTNQPTNQQTNQRIGNEGVSALIPTHGRRIAHLSQIADILSTLDDVKKEVRIKFKQLTEQEMAVFAAIYKLEEQGFIVDYPLLSEHLSLSEISIRDYTRKIIQKGIPLNKTKLDRKRIALTIPSDLKRMASLSTIESLREL